MNLLIIGNGFDLAHGLKTNYYDFLQWAYDNGHMGTNYGEHVLGNEKLQMPIPGFNLHSYWHNICNPDAEQNEVPAFAKTLFRRHESWIDLENNFAACLNSRDGWLIGKTKILKALFDEFLVPKFEQYIAEVVNDDSVAANTLSVSGADLVLCFNYSNTFERLYDKRQRAKICYVNGKAQGNATTSNIVFGCDCYEDSPHGKSEVGFDKVFQRAHKKTCDDYKDWISEDDNHHYRIYIVGHSLGRTDWDILRPLIIAKTNTAKVYYHNEESHRDLIYNMMGMVGRESMNQRKIKFLPIAELNIEHRDGFTVIG